MITLYKDSRDTKLGVTFFRRDPQDNASPGSAIVSRINAQGAAHGKLEMGERIYQVNGTAVEGPLHAARLLRESEGFLKITKIPKRDDFDVNLERYQQIEAEAARQAMAAALPGQEPQRTPRTDAATPRGGGTSAGMVAAQAQYSSGLRPLNQQAGGSPGGLQLNNMNLAQNLQEAGGQLSARTQEIAGNLGDQWGQLSARAGKWFDKVGKNVSKVGELLPTQQNKETRSAVKIQKAWRSYGAQAHFHEERGAALMLQSAARRRKAQAVRKYKETLISWAAIVIQEAYRKHKLKQKAKELAEANSSAATPRSKGSVVGRLAKSLSFSRRASSKTTAAKATTSKPSVPAEVTADDLRAEGINVPATPAAQPKNKRSFSFSRRQKKAE